MLDFYAHLWPWLAACLAVGAATGALVHGEATRKRPANWLLWFGATFVAGVAAVALGAVNAVVSANVESALACFAAFIAGAAAVAAARGTLAAHEGWALGLVPAALLWWGAIEIAEPAYQAELQKRIASLAQAAGVDPAGVGVSGRDIAAPPAIAGNEALMAQIESTPGVRRVVAAKGVVATAAAPALVRPEKEPDQTATIPSPGLGPVSPPVPERDPGAALASLPAGELDAATCQRALDAVATGEPVSFHAARTTIDRRAALALDKAVEVIRRCPVATIEVRGHGDDEALARRRALAAERYLRLEGVGGRRLVAAPCCADAREQRRGAGVIDYILR